MPPNEDGHSLTKSARATTGPCLMYYGWIAPTRKQLMLMRSKVAVMSRSQMNEGQ
jgi:hypothetical protein